MPLKKQNTLQIKTCFWKHRTHYGLENAFETQNILRIWKHRTHYGLENAFGNTEHTLRIKKCLWKHRTHYGLENAFGNKEHTTNYMSSLKRFKKYTEVKKRQKKCRVEFCSDLKQFIRHFYLQSYVRRLRETGSVADVRTGLFVSRDCASVT